MSDLSIDKVPQTFNVIYLFAARRVNPQGKFVWKFSDIDADVAACRKRGQRVVLSIGGSRNDVNFTSRTVAQRLINSVVDINRSLGGTRTKPALDGVDFNTFEDGQPPVLEAYRWMAQELRNYFGAGFGITCPPAPWRLRDQEFCREMLSSDSMDYVGPQFYDGPGLSDPDYIVKAVDQWVKTVAAGNAHKIVVGFGIAKARNYSTIEQVSTAVQSIKESYPDIRGAFLWEHLDWPRPHTQFAQEVAPYL